MISKKIYGLKPAYRDKYAQLIKDYSQFGGGAKDEQYVQAKSFSNTYEFYIYAYFLGLKTNTKDELLDAKEISTFWDIENWKPRNLVDYLISCAISSSDFDMIGIESASESEVSEQIGILKRNIETYANGGFSFILKLIQDDPDCIEDDRLFVRLIADHS
tara:strand:+ start:602 stop:1081 length:480 start_codon:yes stop_codon:yes gene_type:complete